MNINEIEKYLTEIQNAESNFRSHYTNVPTEIQTSKRLNFTRILGLGKFIILSFVDFISLLLLILFKKSVVNDKRIVYTGKGSCIEVNGILEDRIVKPLFTENILFINSQKETWLKKVNNQKVYNLGGVVKLISLFLFRKRTYKMRIFGAYCLINNLILSNLNGNEVYMICLWEMNSFSLIFSRYRSNIKLIKVQHGSMIEYPPYVNPAPVKVADLIYVKNKPTIEYLKTHLCSRFPTEYRLIPYPEKNLIYVPGIHLFYASTIETNGLHPVFRDFLAKNVRNDLHIIVRLHPREREKEATFAEELSKFNIYYEFDQSENWLKGNKIKNLIVISPWSSTLEEAYDNGFSAITIDIVGRERFKHLIDNIRFFYSDDLNSQIDYILKLKT